MRTLLALSLTTLVIGCGSDPEYATPTGLVAGEVTDGVTGAVLPGTAVALWTGDRVHETTTGDDGRFEIDGVPSGSQLWLDLARDGYALLRHRIAVDDSAGEQPQDNSLILLDAEMFPNSNRVTVTVQMGIDGLSPGSGIEVQARGQGLGFEYPTVLVGTTDGSGRAIVQGIATWQSYELRVLPFTYMGENYAASSFYVNATQADETIVTVF